jgi:hypothetical protein
MTQPKAFATKKPKATNINPYRADIEDIVLRLANKELERKANSGKTEFTAIVIKVLSPSNVTESDRQILTDLFLNEEYAIDREDNLTYFSNSNKKIAFLHIPALYSYTTLYTTSDSKKSDVTTSDLFLFPVVTGLDLAPQQQVKVTFGDLEDFKELRIIPPPASDKKKQTKKDKKSTKGSVNKLTVLMKARDACTKLQNTPPSGSKISSKSLVNPSNPLVGYSGFYGDYIKDILTSETLRRRTILTLGTTEAKTKLFKPGAQITPLTSDNVENALIAESSYATFGVKIYVGDNKIKEFIEANDTSTTFKNAESFPIEVAKPEIKGSFNFSSIGKKQEIDKKNRSIYLEVVPLNPEGQKPDSKLKSPNQINDVIVDNVKDYIAGVTRNKYNYSFDSSQNIFAIDIFGKTSDDQLIEGDVDLAIDYSKAKKSTSQPQPGVLQPIISFFQQQPKKNPTPTAAGKESTATPNQELNACGASNKLVNENAYFSLEDDKTVSQTSYSKDNALFTKFYQAANLLGITDISEAAIRSQEPSEADLKKFSSKVFSYEAKEEVISVIEEGKEVKSQKKNKKLSTNSGNKANTTGALNIGRGTNLQQIQKNTQNLINFVKSFRKFIAQNEGVPETSVTILPLSTFRKFIDVKKLRQGIDQNSRHFFNRAIDFVVYINNDPNFIGFSTDGSPTIPKKDTFEIPNYIVYAYLLKFIKQNGSKFGQSGIGLLERSQKRKTGYIHYEIMSDYREPERGVQRAKRERRWVSQPQNDNKESVYKQAFDKNNKDSIIIQFVIKKLETQVGANLPEKFTRILK